MRLKELIHTAKVVTDWGDGWKSGKMPPKDFPLSKSGRGWPVRASFQWKVLEIDASGKKLRLAVVFNAAKENYHAKLGLIEDKDTRVLASLEFHGTHAGWHVHSACKQNDINQIPAGRLNVKGPDFVRFPGGKAKHRRNVFGITENNALELAFKTFGISANRDSSQTDIFEK